MFDMKRVFVVFAVGVLSAEARDAGRILSIRPRVEAKGPQVLLADVARSADELPEAWRDRVVMRSPAPGEQRDYPLTSLAYALQQYPDMHDTSLRGPLQLKIQRKGRPIEQQKIEQAILAYVRSTPPWQGRDVVVELEKTSQTLLVSEAKAGIRVAGHADERGRSATRFDMVVEAPDTVPQNAGIYADIRVREAIWTAAAFLDRGAILGANDVQATNRLRDEIRENCIPVSDSIAGLEIIRSLSPGDPICRHYLRQPVCAESGEMLSVSANRGPVEVTLRARALGRGRRGERILCVNEQSKRKILVRLTGPKKAVVENHAM